MDPAIGIEPVIIVWMSPTRNTRVPLFYLQLSEVKASSLRDKSHCRQQYRYPPLAALKLGAMLPTHASCMSSLDS